MPGATGAGRFVIAYVDKWSHRQTAEETVIDCTAHPVVVRKTRHSYLLCSID